MAPAGTCVKRRYEDQGTTSEITITQKKVGEYLVGDSIAAIVALGQMGVVEIHTSNCTTDQAERPNRLAWDIDPRADVECTQAVLAARVLCTELTRWDCKRGSRPPVVLVCTAPVDPERDWCECLQFARAVASKR